MKKVLPICLILAVILCSVAASGCVSYKQDTPQITKPLAEINGLYISDSYTYITLRVYSNPGHEFDSKNIIVNQTGNVFYVYIQDNGTSGPGNEWRGDSVEIKLINKYKLNENEDYTIIINDLNHSDKSNVFRIENKKLVTYTFAGVYTLDIEESEGKVIAVLNILNATDMVLDEESIIVEDFDENGRCEIIFPCKVYHDLFNFFS